MGIDIEQAYLREDNFSDPAMGSRISGLWGGLRYSTRWSKRASAIAC
jgi:hypothetical protein